MEIDDSDFEELKLTIEAFSSFCWILRCAHSQGLLFPSSQARVQKEFEKALQIVESRCKSARCKLLSRRAVLQ